MQYLGAYEDAVLQIGRLRNVAETDKQAYLTRLAKLEGLLNNGKIPLPEKVYQCIVLDPPWYYSMRNNDQTHQQS